MLLVHLAEPLVVQLQSRMGGQGFRLGDPLEEAKVLIRDRMLLPIPMPDRLDDFLDRGRAKCSLFLGRYLGPSSGRHSGFFQRLIQFGHGLIQRSGCFRAGRVLAVDFFVLIVGIFFGGFLGLCGSGPGSRPSRRPRA